MRAFERSDLEEPLSASRTLASSGGSRYAPSNSLNDSSTPNILICRHSDMSGARLISGTGCLSIVLV